MRPPIFEYARLTTNVVDTDLRLVHRIERNNVTRSIDENSMDGYSICTHGVDSAGNGANCRNHTWSIYCDGVSSGVNLSSNVLSAALQGAVYFHQGGQNTAVNNVIIGGSQYLFSIGSHDQYGQTIERNIFSWDKPTSKILYDFDVPTDHDNSSNLYVKGVLESSDRNLFHPPQGVDVMSGSAANPLFPAGDGGLAGWRKATGFDTHSIVADPKFADPARGDYSVTTESPAVRQLGFVPIAPIDPLVPHAEDVGAPNASASTSVSTIEAAINANCSWNAAVDPRCDHMSGPGECSCSGSATAGHCAGACDGCAFNYTYDAQGVVLSGITPRCLLLAVDPDPLQDSSDWYALSASRPLRVARSTALTLRRPAPNVCPVPVGSYDMADSCYTCHVDATCALRCECKAGSDSHYSPMGCDLWQCNDLALNQGSLTCRGQICPAASTPLCPAPQGSYGTSCTQCWVDQAVSAQTACHLIYHRKTYTPPHSP